MGFGERVETSRFYRNMHRRIIRNFLDVLILTELRKGSLSGYDVITFVHEKFHLLVSSGTVYSMFYSLERNGLIVGAWMQRKRVYRLTDEGKRTIKRIMSASDETRYLVLSLLKSQKESQDQQ